MEQHDSSAKGTPCPVALDEREEAIRKLAEFLSLSVEYVREQAKNSSLEQIQKLLVSLAELRVTREYPDVSAMARRTLVPSICSSCGMSGVYKANGKGQGLCYKCANRVVVQIRNTGPRVGRNDPCPCGSGKKFKACHKRGV